MIRYGILLLIVCFIFSACTSYGKKIDINAHSEVYYKGEEVTEAEAKKLGNFLREKNFFNNEEERSVQLTKESGTYTVRIVADEEKVNKDKENVVLAFKIWQLWIAENVFPGSPTRLVLTNDSFEDYLPVGTLTDEQKAQLQQEEAMEHKVNEP